MLTIWYRYFQQSQYFTSIFDDALGLYVLRNPKVASQRCPYDPLGMTSRSPTLLCSTPDNGATGCRRGKDALDAVRPIRSDDYEG